MKLATVNNASNPYYIVSDHLGSSSILSDNIGNIAELSDYEPYGTVNYNQVINNLGDSYKFVGKEFDLENSLQYFGARYLDNSTTKFYSIDSILIKYNFKYYLLSNPQKLNSYSYGYNNPLYFIDLDGQEGISWKDVPVIRGILRYIETHPAQSTNVTVGFTPVGGEFQDAYETVTGKEAWTGEQLSTTQRFISGGSFFLPFVGAKIARKGWADFTSSFKKVDNARPAFRSLRELDIMKHGQEGLEKVSGITGRSIDDILEEASSSRARFIDHTNDGNINIFINNPDAGNDLIRVTTDPDMKRIISGGFNKSSNVMNNINRGRFELIQ